jgi:hypothetical protein
LATTPTLGEGLLHARWFNIFVVEFELFFGIWLIFGMLPKLTWLMSIGLFFLVSIISFHKAVSGETSCGCFGNVTVNPWITMTFDLCVVVLLVCLRFNKKYPEKLDREFFYQYNLRLILWAGICVLLGSSAYGWITQKTYERLENIGQVLESNIVQLEPESWIGREFPLRDYVIDGQKMMRGKWIIMFSRHGCSDCETIKTKLLKNKDQNIMLAFLDITAMAATNNSPIIAQNFQIVPEINWIMATPVIIELSEGIVQNVQKREYLLLPQKTSFKIGIVR